MGNQSKNSLAAMSDADLAKKKNSMLVVFSCLVGVALLAIAYMIYRMATSGLDGIAPLGGTVAITGGLGAIFGAQYDQAKKEMQRREQARA